MRHTAIVENKRLSHALATVKAQKDNKHEPKVQTNSEKIGYKKEPSLTLRTQLQTERRSGARGGDDSLMESEENIKPFPFLKARHCHLEPHV
ncbi:hypothetical protein [Granulicella arctica]|uniref:hypothetical protein n=1 Tax=Granulicella arctica TaxID=940613 RepID=UPI0021E0F4FD|nr:hypothetical protein [Granulicella arctica]